MQARSAVTTFLFTDIEGSTRLWEADRERMSEALAGRTTPWRAEHDVALHVRCGLHVGVLEAATMTTSAAPSIARRAS